jgi:hypothetical protein
MLKFTSLLTAAATTFALVAGPTFASSFNGAYWDSNGFSTIDQAYAYTQNNTATATFNSTAIDYPNAGGSITSNTTLQMFLGATGDGLTLSGAQDNTLEKSVFTFSGILDLSGTQSIKVGSDDGFGLKLNGAEVLRYSTPRGFSYTFGTYDFTGPTTFELTYYENYGNTGVEFLIGDTIVNAAMAPAPSAPPAIPVPAALPLLLGALGGLGLLRRRSATKA